MGGPGSGNWYRWDSKDTTESQNRVDIRYLKQQGYLKPGAIGTLSWTCNQKESGSVAFRMESERLVLNYRHRSQGSDWEPVEQSINLDWTRCNYGGRRTWLLCPKCRRRVALLYGAGKYFLCRHCYNLTYSSQQECGADRLMRKARKIRKRLGASRNLMVPILFKPKNMHHKTFDRLKLEADLVSRLGWLIAAQQFGLEI